jgi:hypothetical protein
MKNGISSQGIATGDFSIVNIYNKIYNDITVLHGRYRDTGCSTFPILSFKQKAKGTEIQQKMARFKKKGEYIGKCDKRRLATSVSKAHHFSTDGIAVKLCARKVLGV